MDSSRSEETLYAGFTCTSLQEQSDKVIIEVDYDKCRKVAFAEDLGLEGKKAEVKYPLFELYKALKGKSQIEINKDDYVFIVWLQPIPPTFHTINQVAYIVYIAKKLKGKGIKVALTPYIYFYLEKYVEKVIKNISEIFKKYKEEGENLNKELEEMLRESEIQLKLSVDVKLSQLEENIIIKVCPKAVKKKKKKNKDVLRDCIDTLRSHLELRLRFVLLYKLWSKLNLLREITQNLPIYPSLIIHTETPSVTGWFDKIFTERQRDESPFFDCNILREWLNGLFTHDKFVEIIKEYAKLQLQEDEKEEIKTTISLIYRIIPDALPLNVAYSILFPLNSLDRFFGLGELKLLLFGLTPRDIVYFIASKFVLSDKNELRERMFYIPTRSIIHDYNKFKKSLEKGEIIKAFKVPGEGISLPRLLLFYEYIDQHIELYICKDDEKPIECEVLKKAKEIYDVIKQNTGRIHNTNAKRGDLFYLLYEGTYSYSHSESRSKVMPALYYSKTKGITYIYIMHLREGVGSPQTKIPEIWIPKKIKLSPKPGTGFFRILLNEKSSPPIASDFTLVEKLFGLIKRGDPKEIKKLPKFIPKFTIGQISGEKLFLLTNVLYTQVVRG